MLTFFIFVLIVLGIFAIYAVKQTGVDNDPLSRVIEKTDSRCPACDEYLPARKVDRDPHLLRHISEHGAPQIVAYTWRCKLPCEPDRVWMNRSTALLGLQDHFYTRHKIRPAFD